MAIWQFDFYLENPDDDIWDTKKVFKKHIKRLSKILKRTKGWTESIEFYGHNDKTCVQIMYKDKKILEIMVRLDIRTITEMLFNDIFIFLQNMDCKHIIVDGKNIPLNRSMLINEIINSSQYSFVKNPYVFLDLCEKDLKEVNDK